MCTNTSKTEAMLFAKKYEARMLWIDGQEIKTGSTIKVLGITFAHNLSWTPHIEKVVKKASSVANRVRFIRQTLSTNQCLKILTSYYYSSIYYGSAVWLGAMTASNDWKLPNKAHYHALRTAARDYRKTMSRRSLDCMCKRATPKQWSYYCIASMAISILVTKQPGLLHDSIDGNISINGRRTNRPSFYDSSRTRIGRQSIENCLTETFKNLQDVDWLGTGLSKDAIRVRLKRMFFPYYTIDEDKKRTME
jgi:hypothetical protein